MCPQQIHVSHKRNSKSLKLVQSPNFLPRNMQIREYSTQDSLRITKQGKKYSTTPNLDEQLLSRDVYVVSLFCVTFHSKDGKICVDLIMVRVSMNSFTVLQHNFHIILTLFSFGA